MNSEHNIGAMGLRFLFFDKRSGQHDLPDQGIALTGSIFKHKQLECPSEAHCQIVAVALFPAYC